MLPWNPITLPSRIGPHVYGAPVRPETDRRGSHTSQNARCMRHPVGEDVRLSRLSGTKPECALESTVSPITLLSRIGPHLRVAPVRPARTPPRLTHIGFSQMYRPTGREAYK